MKKPTPAGLTLGLGLAFLYLPVAVLVVYSFNAARLVNVWGGFSVQWYGQLLRNEALLAAAGRSLLVAAGSASVALVLGTLAALALARGQRFRMRGALLALLAAPLVLPDVVLGLGLLLAFVALEQAIGWPAGRGLFTVAAAHVTLSIAYVTAVVRARLARLDPALEEAARDLGATPLVTLWRVTLPQLGPALLAGWLLAFTLSFDDLVVASFTSGPGATTLPMAVYSMARLGVSPQVNALATLLLAALAVVLLGLYRLARRRPEAL